IAERQHLRQKRSVLFATLQCCGLEQITYRGDARTANLAQVRPGHEILLIVPGDRRLIGISILLFDDQWCAINWSAVFAQPNGQKAERRERRTSDVTFACAVRPGCEIVCSV